jgi:hypothetical protein
MPTRRPIPQGISQSQFLVWAAQYNWLCITQAPHSDTDLGYRIGKERGYKYQRSLYATPQGNTVIVITKLPKVEIDWQASTIVDIY